VQESRGNRQGNAAFYQSIFGSSGMTPENTLYQCKFLREFMSFIAKPVFKDKDVIDGFIELGGRQESLSVYFSVAAGNYELAARIIEAGDNYFGHNFNHLFAETLKVNLISKELINLFYLPYLFILNSLMAKRNLLITESPRFLRRLLISMVLLLSIVLLSTVHPTISRNFLRSLMPVKCLKLTH
jgi:hypothetical protein